MYPITLTNGTQGSPIKIALWKFLQFYPLVISIKILPFFFIQIARVTFGRTIKKNLNIGVLASM